MSERPAKRVLLIGWDGAEWEIIRPLARQGLLPHLTRLIDTGISGDLRSPSPHLSPMAWTSIATGKRAFRHGVLGHLEPSADGLRHWSSASRATNAVWNILSHTGLRTHVVNWYASHPAERVNGVCVSEGFPAFGPTTSTVEPHSSGPALVPLHLRPSEVDAELLSALIPGAAAPDAAAAPLIRGARQALADAATVHAIATHLVAPRAFDFCAVLYRGIEQFSHAFERFSPPRMAGVSETEFERFGSVVARVYEFHDQMLGRLLELAGPDTTVVLCSDHGFATAGRRAAAIPRTPDDAATLSHRPHGIFVAARPGIRPDDTIEGASVLDVAPSILVLLGEPVGRDMDGRPLLGAIARPPAEVDSIPSWDVVVPPPVTAAEFSEAAWDAIEHLLPMGFVDPHAADDAASRDAFDEILFNLARAYLDARRPHWAAPLLEHLVSRRPEHLGYRARCFDALFELRRYEDARVLVDAAVARAGDSALSELAYAALEVAGHRAASALAHLDRAAAWECELPEFHALRGEVYLRLGRHTEAADAFARALAWDDRLARAWDGRAAALIGQRRYADAADAALHAVASHADDAPAHFHLGVALARLGQFTRAATALARATDLWPDLLPAHRLLAELYDGPLDDPAAGRDRRLRVAEISLRRRGDRAGGGGPVPA